MNVFTIEGGLYNAIFDRNEMGPVILATLDLSEQSFGRYRDLWFKEGRIAVYTRCGGGNREAYAHVFKAMSQHELFDRAEDDKMDSTYCTFYFHFPEDYEELFSRMPDGLSGDERWEKALAELQAGNQNIAKRGMAVIGPIIEAINKQSEEK